MSKERSKKAFLKSEISVGYFWDRVMLYYCFILLFLLLSGGCNKTSSNSIFLSKHDIGSWTFFDIPDITQEEILAIKEMQDKGISFVVYAPHNTELFYDENDEEIGYIAMFCDWLSGLFNIKFEAVIDDLGVIVQKVESFEAIFAVQVITEDRQKRYFMTDTITQRSVQILRLDDSLPTSLIALDRPLRYVFLEGSMQADLFAESQESGSYQELIAQDYESVYRLLQSGEADAFIGNNAMEIAFDVYGGVITEPFLPQTFIPVALATGNADLQPIISVITKALQAGAYSHLTELYRKGLQDYKRHRFNMRLTEDEKIYIKNNPVIPFASQYMSYPVSFFNKNENKWEGVVFDVLTEIESLSELSFVLANDTTTELGELMRMLETEIAYFIPNLIQSDERKERFIWTNIKYIKDRYALLSKQSYPNIELNDIPFEKIGYARGSAFADMFRKWFPNAVNAREYPNTDEAFMALDRGEIDLVMSSQSRLAALTNYYEFSDYKANYLFSADFESTFGLNKNQEILCSILDKALLFIDTDRILEQWQTKTYNYQAKRLRDRHTWTIVTAAIVVIFMLIIFYILFLENLKNKRKNTLFSEQASNLEATNERIETIIKNLPGMVFQQLYNPPEYTFVFVSRGCNELIGYTAEELNKSKTFGLLDMIHTDDIPSIEKLSAETLLLGLPFETTYRIKTKDGIEKWVWERSRVIKKNADGSPYMIEGYCTDVTERMKLEQAELEQKRILSRIEAIISNLPGMVFQCLGTFPDYPLTYVSNGCFELLGYTPEELLTAPNKYMVMLHPDDLAEYEKKVFETTEIGLPFESTHRLILKDGSIKWVLERCVVTEKNPDGSPALLDGYLCDLTEIKNLEEARLEYQSELMEINKNLQLIFYSMPLGVRVVSRETGELLYVNEEVLKILGASGAGSEIEGRNVFEFMPEIQPNGKKTIEMVNELNKKDKSTMDFECIRLNGEVFTARVYSCNINYMGHLSSLAVIEDITEKNKMIESMQRASIAEASNLAKSQFLANMSHEIRTPFNSIMGFAELAIDSDTMPQMKKYLAKIIENTSWLLHIINDILDVSKIESGKMELDNVPFNLVDVFSRCQSVILPLIKEKGLELSIYVEPLINKKLVGDPLRLYQVLINLLSNAVKFTESGVVKFTSTILAPVESYTTNGTPTGDVKVYFEVKDTGIGMTTQQMNRIFEPFIQADSSTTREYGGTGLGLPIAKNIVELMNGKLELESTPGVGSSFSFEIVFKTIDCFDDYSKQEKLSIVEKPHFEGLVLVCDDNSMNQEVICEHLDRVGLDTMIAQNGKEAADMVYERLEKKEKPFDLIFMDMFMPVMDGMEAATKIHTLHTGTPIVAMTANVMVGELEKYKKYGMPDCLGKPFTSQELWHILLKYLNPISSDIKDDFNDDAELQKKLKINFLRNNHSIHTQIKEAVDNKDFALAHRLAHTLKGNAALIGKTKLKNIASEIEECLKNITTTSLEDKIEALRTELFLVLEDLSPLNDEPNQKSKNKIYDASEVSTLFDRLQELLEKINPESVYLIDEILSIPGTELLAQQIENFEFEAALKTLAELRDKG